MTEHLKETIKWYFIEVISQLDIDNITDADFDEAIKNDICSTTSILELRAIWQDADMCVANP